MTCLVFLQINTRRFFVVVFTFCFSMTKQCSLYDKLMKGLRIYRLSVKVTMLMMCRMTSVEHMGDSSVLKKTFHICKVTCEFTNLQNVVI